MPVTETRNFTAGLRLDGRRSTLEYEVSERVVLLTLFGSTADLDTLESSALVISLNVADLVPGPNEVPVVPELPSAVAVAAISPETVIVTVTGASDAGAQRRADADSGAERARHGAAERRTLTGDARPTDLHEDPA